MADDDGEAINASPHDIDFLAIKQLMTTKYTMELVDRHVAAIRKVCRICKNGFLLQHVEYLVDLLRLVVQRFSMGHEVFAIAICDFVLGVPSS